MKRFLNNFNWNFLGLFGIIWTNFSILYPPTLDPEKWIWIIRFGILCIWISILMNFRRWIKKRIKYVSFKTYKKRYPNRNRFQYLLMFLICDLIGWHSWTTNAEQGVKPTIEERDAGVEGFWHYAKMYCNRCDCPSQFNIPTKFQPRNETNKENNS